MWADFSAWLVTVGVILGLIAAIFGLIDSSQQPVDRRPTTGVAARERKRCDAYSRDAQHVRSLTRRVDLSCALGFWFVSAAVVILLIFTTWSGTIAPSIATEWELLNESPETCYRWRLSRRRRLRPIRPAFRYLKPNRSQSRSARPSSNICFRQMHLSSVVGWKNGEMPTVAPGLKIEALATGLQHPRSLYTLPNGDVLVVESKAPPPQLITRPKDLVMRFIEKGVTSGGDPGPSNRTHAFALRRHWRKAARAIDLS